MSRSATTLLLVLLIGLVVTLFRGAIGDGFDSLSSANKGGQVIIVKVAGDSPPVVEKKNSPEPLAEKLSVEENEALELLNSDRRASGLPPLMVNSKLAKLARGYARDMITRSFFAHVNPEGQNPFDRMRQCGIIFRYAGENLAINSGVEAAESAFMGSPEHRANVLNSHFDKIGIGVYHDANGAVYVVQEFTGD